MGLNMSELPSVWSLIVSTVAFFVAAWYVRRYLDEQGLPKGMTRRILVFTLAFVASWGAGRAVDWLLGEPQNKQAAAQPGDEVSQMLQGLGQAQRVR